MAWMLEKRMFLRWQGYLLGTGLVALATGLKYLAQPQIVATNSSIIYMLAVVPVAVYFGFGPAIFTAILSMLVDDYFFIPPLYTIGPRHTQDIPMLLIFLAVGIIISYLASNLRHRSDHLLIANEELQLRAAILDKATDAIFLRDLQNNILYANDVASRMYGYRQEEFIGMNQRTLIAPQELPFFEERTRLVIEKGELSIEAFHQRKDRSVIPVEVHSHLIKIAEKNYILAVNHNVAEQIRLREERNDLAKKLVEAQEKERKWIARELHDDTAPTLSYLGLEIDALISRYSGLSDDIIHRLQNLREKINRAQHDVRRFSHQLHSAVLDDMGLVAALEVLIAEINEKANIEGQVQITGPEKKLSPEINLAFYRIAQEALSNVQKHSLATSVIISLQYLTNIVRVTITDNGRGFDLSQKAQPAKGGTLGLTSMRERAYLIGADFNIKSEIGKGTEVAVQIHL